MYFALTRLLQVAASAFCTTNTLSLAGLVNRVALICVLIFCVVPRVSDAECGRLDLAFYELGALYYKTPQGDYTGIDKDVLDELSRRTGCQFQTVLESRVRIWSQLSQHELDMSVSGIETPARNEFAYFIPYFATRNFALLQLYLPASAHTMEGFLQNPQLRVAVVKSFKHGQQYDLWLDKLRQLDRVVEAADFDSVMRIFMAKRVDAMLALPTSLEPLRRKDLPLPFIVLDWVPSDYVPHGLIISRKRVPNATVELLRTQIKHMQDDGTLEKIYSHHVGADLAKALKLRH